MATLQPWDCHSREKGKIDINSRYIFIHKGLPWTMKTRERIRGTMPWRKRNRKNQGDKSYMNIRRGRVAAWRVLEMWELARLLSGLICYGCESMMILSHRSVEHFLTKCLPINPIRSFPSSYIKKKTLVVIWNWSTTVCMICYWSKNNPMMHGIP